MNVIDTNKAIYGGFLRTENTTCSLYVEFSNHEISRIFPLENFCNFLSTIAPNAVHTGNLNHDKTKVKLLETPQVTPKPEPSDEGLSLEERTLTAINPELAKHYANEQLLSFPVSGSNTYPVEALFNDQKDILTFVACDSSLDVSYEIFRETAFHILYDRSINWAPLSQKPDYVDKAARQVGVSQRYLFNSGDTFAYNPNPLPSTREILTSAYKTIKNLFGKKERL